MLAVVMGIPGVGKTTVLRYLKEKNLEIINYGDVMFEIASSKGLVSNRDEMRKLEAKLQLEIQNEAATKIYEFSKGKKVILDTHASIKTPSGYLPGLPLRILERLKPDLFILLEANAEDIARRRGKDVTRERDKESFEEIELHMQMNRMMCSSFSVITGAPTLIVKNEEGKAKEAAEEILKAIEAIEF